jgi:hypothetical protein
MVMPRNRLIRAFSANVAMTTVLASSLALAACGPAAVTTAATYTRATTASATGSAVANGRASIMLYSINSDGPGFRAIIAGAVGDYGPAVTVDPDGKVDAKHGSEMKLNLTRGSFRLSIAGSDKKFVAAASHEPIYPATCSDLLSVTAAVPIVAGSGTGAYRGISGSFSVTATLHEVEATPCQHANAFLWQAIIVSGPGTVSVG